MLCFEVLRDRNILVVRSEGPPEQADFDSSPDRWSSRAEETRNEGTLDSVKAAGLLVRRARRFAGTNQAHSPTVFGNAVITYNGLFTVTLNCVTVGQLTEGDFIFT